MKIIADAHIPFVQEYFSAYGDLILLPGREICAADVRDADILLVRSVTRVDEKLLAHAHVKFVGSVTAGADHLDSQWLDAAGIMWSVAAGFNAPPVADYVVSVIAALQRKKLLANYRAGAKPVKAAVIGVGQVGRLVAACLALLKIECILCDPLRAENENDFISTPLAEISDVDFISLHVPLTQTGAYPTHHFINKDFFQRQKPDSILLNASRGAVVQSADLLQYGKHLRWCLDVWEHEPAIDKILLENTLIATPHIAGYSVQSKMRGIDLIYQIACEKKIISAHSHPLLSLPSQQLEFAGANHHWQDIILGIFNPLVLTAMMRTLLLPATDHGACFDALREHFNYRHEFRYTEIHAADVSVADMALLNQLGVRV